MATASSQDPEKPSLLFLRAKSPTAQVASSFTSMAVPGRVSSRHMAPAHHIASQAARRVANPVKGAIEGYMVRGLGRDPSEWTVHSQTSNTTPQCSRGSIGSFIVPLILGSIPSHDQDVQTAQIFDSALKATFPNDAEIISSDRVPVSTCHTFVLQRDSSGSLYGVALRLWVKIDMKRRAKILEVLFPQSSDRGGFGAALWMPYCLVYISQYPIFDFLSDYLRFTWMIYGKKHDEFNSKAVLRLLQLPPPKLGKLLQIHVDEYAFYYNPPVDPSRFQNFVLWPAFVCMTATQIVELIDVALSPRGRIILTSQHLAILTNVAECVRFYAKSWFGLYVPVVYGRDIQRHIDEPAPYILGVSKQSRGCCKTPTDALLIDLDFHRTFTHRPPGVLSPRQRRTYAAQLSQALGQSKTDGVPAHLRSAYDREFQFSPVGGFLTSKKEVTAVRDPLWWNPVAVQTVMDRITKKIRQNHNLKATLNIMKKSTTKIGTRDLTEIMHNGNFLARSAESAWQAYIQLKRSSHTKAVIALNKECSLRADLQNQTKEFAELTEVTKRLVDRTRQLQSKVNQQMRDNVSLSGLLQDKTLHAEQLSNHVTELLDELQEMNKTLSVQRARADEIENSGNNATACNTKLEERCAILSQERDEAYRAVIHLTSLISSQTTYIERVTSSLLIRLRRTSSVQEYSTDRRKSLQSQANSSPSFSPILSQFPLPEFEHARSLESNQDISHHTQHPLCSFRPATASQSAFSRNGISVINRAFAEEGVSTAEKIGRVAATARKINEQCHKAVLDLAEKTTEVYESNFEPPSPQNLPRRPVSASLGSVSASQIPSAISCLVEMTRSETRPIDNKSSTSSQMSRGTTLISGNTLASLRLRSDSTTLSAARMHNDKKSKASGQTTSSGISSSTNKTPLEEDEAVCNKNLLAKEQTRKSSGIFCQNFYL